ncbi:hypothetical protein HGI30_15555 [Paenibacillus albicereus]|uniref:Copper amine oxidase-like N-terminal domain-containing protein n=1 Tax=Paenibacillus albicereus TaxID=2726185 RepID=A0A6H2GZS0_9BACL|nr:stalk domain-containing protein [Paenibacillus albicereus]QJC52839.1 hypothetical protein HGI30_15555 [Paenibacillus albicereus]
MNKNRLRHAAIAAGLLAAIALGTGGPRVEAAGAAIADFDASSLIRSDGSYWVWGDNRPVPTPILDLNDAKASLGAHLVQKKDGTVWRWEPTPSGFRVEALPALGPVDSVFDEGGMLIAVQEDGLVKRIPVSSEEPETSGIESIELGGARAVQADGFYDKSSYERIIVFLTSEGGLLRSVRTKEGGLTAPQAVRGMDQVADIAGSLVLKKDGTVWSLAAADNPASSPLEDSPSLAASRVQPLVAIAAIRSNGESHLAIDRQGNAWFWGQTRTGFTDGTILHEHPVPLRLQNISGVRDAAFVERSLVVLTADGSVMETSTDLEKLAADAAFRKLAVGIVRLEPDKRHLILQKADGSLWGWGINKLAQLGHGDFAFEHRTPVAVQRAISVAVNGEKVPLMNGVILRNDQAFVPVRSIFEKLGASVVWDFYLKLASIKQSSEGKSVSLAMDFKAQAWTLDGKPAPLKTEPFIENGTAYLPLRFISESLGAKVDWDQDEDRISISR